MNEKLYTTRNSCRVCGSDQLDPMFSLGEQFVSDFVTEDKIHSGHKVPIDIERCRECTLVQAKHTAPQDFLYSRFYWYRSGVTKTMRDALEDVVNAATQRVDVSYRDVVLDIGSNDGTLLRNYSSDLIRVGVEPADNLATAENYKDLSLIHSFWDSTATWGLMTTWGKKPKIVTAIGMFYDLEDPNQFVGDIAKVLHPEGIFVSQLMCLRQMLQAGDVGNLAHEHLEFYTLQSLNHLFDKHGLVIYDVEQNQVNVGSYRLYACHRDSDHLKNQTRMMRDRIVAAHLAEDERCSVAAIKGFSNHLEDNRKLIRGFIEAQVADGKTIHIYGASTKGNVIAQWLGLDRDLIRCAADKSPEKFGKFMIGTGIPIVSECISRGIKPDFYLCLPFAFFPEFYAREKEWHGAGGRWIIPLPTMRIV